MSRALTITGIVVATGILVAFFADGGTRREVLIALTAFALGNFIGLVVKHEMWVWVKKYGKTGKKDK